LFNALTGTYEYVGNWSGVTVEKKVGRLKSHIGNLVDLPGIYELSPISKDETVVTDYLLNNDFSGMINIIDASQLKRNLLLTVQLMELGAPLIIGLNMIDVATKRGIHIDQKALMKKLKLSLLPIIARNGKGTHQLLDALKGHTLSRNKPLKLNYGEKVESTISSIEKHLATCPTIEKRLLRFISIQFLLDNPKIYDFLDDAVLAKIKPLRGKLSEKLNNSIRDVIQNTRAMYRDSLGNGAVPYAHTQSPYCTDGLERVLAGKYLGLPVLSGVMGLVFHISYTWVGTPVSEALGAFLRGSFTDAVPN